MQNFEKTLMDLFAFHFLCSQQTNAGQLGGCWTVVCYSHLFAAQCNTLPVHWTLQPRHSVSVGRRKQYGIGTRLQLRVFLVSRNLCSFVRHILLTSCSVCVSFSWRQNNFLKMRLVHFICSRRLLRSSACIERCSTKKLCHHCDSR